MLTSLLLSVVVTWQFPRSSSCHEGLAFADGKTGVLVWGGENTINLTVGRGDLWDHRGGFVWEDKLTYQAIVDLVAKNDMQALKELVKLPPTPAGEPRNPYMLPLGRVEVKLVGAKLDRGELDTATGLGKLILDDGREIQLAMSKRSRTFAMEFPEDLEYATEAIPSMEFPLVREKLLPLGFKDAVKTEEGFVWELVSRADLPVALRVQKKARELKLATARSAAMPDIPNVSFEKLAAESVAYWREFWEKGARIKVPDEKVQLIYDYGMYRFGAMTDPDGTPAGLQGQWLEDDKLVPWNGDYHFNINVQECYSPAFKSGHLENLMPLFKMILSWKDKLRKNAKKFVGIDNGYILSHATDDQGRVGGGFWSGTIDHTSTAWIADMMFKYVLYTGDVKFLREEVYDFLKGTMNVYRQMLAETADGKLEMPISSSPEFGGSSPQDCVGRNPSFQLAGCHRTARNLIIAAKMLGEEPEAMWKDVEERLPLYTAVYPTKEKPYPDDGIIIWEGQTLNNSHRHHSHMAALFPFDLIDIKAKEHKEIVELTYWNLVWRGYGEWAGWSMPWASILFTHIGADSAAVDMLHDWERYFTNPGHGSRHDRYRTGFAIMNRGRDVRSMTRFGNFPGEEIMQMDGQCASAAAVLELMAHEVNGDTKFFLGCPKEWKEVAFENIALPDGSRVSGRRIDGQVEITVLSGPRKLLGHLFAFEKNDRNFDVGSVTRSSDGSYNVGLNQNGHWPLIAGSCVIGDNGESYRLSELDCSGWEAKAEVYLHLEKGEPVLELTITDDKGTATLIGHLAKFDAKPENVPPLMNGKPWEERRAEILDMFADREFGRRPVERPADLTFTVSADSNTLFGAAIRRKVTISCSGKYGAFAFDAWAFLPRRRGKVPVFVDIHLGQRLRKGGFNPMTPFDPSIPSAPIADIIDSGCAVVIFDNWQLAMDDKKTCFETGVFKAFGPKLSERKPTDWGAMSAWAWGASRVVDWIETQSEFDLNRIGVVGHSRGGKTALWAGATDKRFAVVCDNASGAGGSKLNHIDLPGAEPPGVCGKYLSHFFCDAFANWPWDGKMDDLDQHMLLALTAPRMLCVGSCSEDYWAGQTGQRISCELASEAWEKLGVKGYGDHVRFHMVPGPHHISAANWKYYLEAMKSL